MLRVNLAVVFCTISTLQKWNIGKNKFIKIQIETLLLLQDYNTYIFTYEF